MYAVLVLQLSAEYNTVILSPDAWIKNDVTGKKLCRFCVILNLRDARVRHSKSSTKGASARDKPSALR